MIDPNEVMLKHFRNDPILNDLTGGRIAAKHRYGESWKVGDPSVTVRPDGGIPEIDISVHRIRFEIMCYAKSYQMASKLWLRVVELARDTSRSSIPVEGGNGLLYFINQESAPSLIADPEIGMDVCLSFFDAMIAEEAVS